MMLGVEVVVMVMTVNYGKTMRMVAVGSNAAPVPTGPVVAVPPGIGRPGGGGVPIHHKGGGRTIVVAPTPIVRPVHKVAMDIVERAARPHERWEGIDGLGVGVDILYDDHPVPIGHGLIPDCIGVLLGGLDVGVGVRDVDFFVGGRFCHDHGGALV